MDSQLKLDEEKQNTPLEKRKDTDFFFQEKGMENDHPNEYIELDKSEEKKSLR